jgi:hypothetical protein
MGRYPRERIEARLHLFAIDGAHRVFGVSRMPLQLYSSPSRMRISTQPDRELNLLDWQDTRSTAKCHQLYVARDIGVWCNIETSRFALVYRHGGFT